MPTTFFSCPGCQSQLSADGNGKVTCPNCRRISPVPVAVIPPSSSTPRRVLWLEWGGPWYFNVCQFASLVFGGYSFAVLAFMTLNALASLLMAAGKGSPRSGEFDARDLTIGFAMVQLVMYLGATILTVLVSTLSLVVVDVARRLRKA